MPDESKTTVAGLPVCSLHPDGPWGRIIVNSVRDTAQATRLAAGEGRAYPVLITILPESPK